jgi:hypothetical protein
VVLNIGKGTLNTVETDAEVVLSCYM